MEFSLSIEGSSSCYYATRSSFFCWLFCEFLVGSYLEEVANQFISRELENCEVVLMRVLSKFCRLVGVLEVKFVMLSVSRFLLIGSG